MTQKSSKNGQELGPYMHSLAFLNGPPKDLTAAVCYEGPHGQAHDSPSTCYG